ncbi:hypothetical protein OTU49_002362 [Cherax quadricarinatus]|uniref:Uncharacterized protein n=1 Tax=Cherax quadricarinatus TaxID=27406 RepID=A0AAW0XQ34_CHEQU
MRFQNCIVINVDHLFGLLMQNIQNVFTILTYYLPVSSSSSLATVTIVYSSSSLTVLIHHLTLCSLTMLTHHHPRSLLVSPLTSPFTTARTIPSLHLTFHLAPTLPYVSLNWETTVIGSA